MVATFQSTVRIDQTTGVVGEVIRGGPQRGRPGILSSTDAANNVIGRAFRVVTGSDTDVTADAAGAFAGILANPKVYATQGATTGTLDPTLILPNETEAELLTMGTIVVDLSTAANIGENVYYADATGILAAGTTAPANHTQVPNAEVTVRNTTGAGLAIITLTN